MTTAEGPRGARIFRVETRFQLMAQRPGIVPELALAQADSNLAELEGDFDIWVREAAATVGEALAEFARDPGGPGVAVRAETDCRDLQAVAGQCGFAVVATVAGSLADLVAALAGRHDAAAIACHADALALALKAGPRLATAEVAELLGGLRQLVERARRQPGI